MGEMVQWLVCLDYRSSPCSCADITSQNIQSVLDRKDDEEGDKNSEDILNSLHFGLSVLGIHCCRSIY